MTRQERAISALLLLVCGILITTIIYLYDELENSRVRTQDMPDIMNHAREWTAPVRANAQHEQRQKGCGQSSGKL
jgi:hypothetical protein